MANTNKGLLDGLRRFTLKVRGLSVDGVQGAPYGYRLLGGTQAGSPSAGTWKAGDLVPDRAAMLWAATAAGQPGTWQLANSAPARGYRPPDITLTQQVWMGQSGGTAVFAIGGTYSAGSNADTSTYALGTQSYYVTTNGSGSQALIAGSFGTPLNMTSQSLVLWIRSDSLSAVL